MATPDKYKSIPYTQVNNRTYIQRTNEQKVVTKTIILNFIQHLKNKHS
jgi:hypothetical protein